MSIDVVAFSLGRDRCAAQPPRRTGKCPRLPIREALERYGQQLAAAHATSVVLHTAEQEVASPTGDLDEWTSVYIHNCVLRLVMIYSLVYRHLLEDRRAGGRVVPSLLIAIPSGLLSGRRCGR
jgi:hypothetical protein